MLRRTEFRKTKNDRSFVCLFNCSKLRLALTGYSAIFKSLCHMLFWRYLIPFKKSTCIQPQSYDCVFEKSGLYGYGQYAILKIWGKLRYEEGVQELVVIWSVRKTRYSFLERAGCLSEAKLYMNKRVFAMLRVECCFHFLNVSGLVSIYHAPPLWKMQVLRPETQSTFSSHESFMYLFFNMAALA